MNSQRIFLTFVVVALLVSFLNLSMTLFKYSQVNHVLTGYATNLGYVNITIATQVSVNFTSDHVRWGSGLVTAGETNASLTTIINSSAVVLRGNWSIAPDGTNVTALSLRNDGNVNVSLKLKGGKNATQFFGGAASDNGYKLNVTNKEPLSCMSGGFALGTWYDINTSDATVCAAAGGLGFDDTKDEIWIDIKLIVPTAANNTGSEISDTITATVVAVT